MKGRLKTLLLGGTVFLTGIAVGHYAFRAPAEPTPKVVHSPAKLAEAQTQVDLPPPPNLPAPTPWDASSPLGKALAAPLMANRQKAVEILVEQTPVDKLGALLGGAVLAPRLDDLAYLRQHAYAKWVATAPKDAVLHALASEPEFDAINPGQRYFGMEMPKDSPLAIAFSAWTERDPAAALAAAHQPEFSIRRGEILGNVYATWAATNPTAALASLESASTDDIGRIADIFAALARQNPAAADAEAQKFSPEWDSGAEIAVFSTWYARDPSGAWQGLEQIHSSTVRDETAAHLVALLGEQNPQAALARLQQLPSQQHNSDTLEHIFGYWAIRNPQAALAAARELHNAQDRDIVITQIFNVWMGRAPVAALAAFKQLPQNLKESALEPVAAKLLDSGQSGQVLQLLAQFSPSASAAKIDQDLSTACRDVFSHWAILDPADAFATVLKLRLKGRAFTTATAAIFDHWAKTDPDAMFAAINQTPKDLQSAAAKSAISILTQDDPVAAWAMTQQLATAGVIKLFDRKNQDGDPVQEVFSAWAIRDPAAAWLAAKDLPADKMGNILSGIFSNWEGQDPAAALAAYEQLDHAARLKYFGVNTEDSLHNAFSAWTADDPAAALQGALTLDSAKDRNTSVRDIFEMWSQSDPTAAYAALGQIADVATRKSASESVLAAMSAQNPQAALALAQKDPAMLASTNVASAIYSNWAQQDPSTAAAAAANLPLNAARGAALGSVATAWANTDPQAAYAWAANLTGNDSILVLTKVITATAQDDPVSAAAELDKLPDNYQHDMLVQEIAGNWANSDPKATLAWLANSTSNGINDAAVAEVLTEMGQADPVGAGNYIAQMADSSTKNTAISALIGQWAPSDPAAAAQWALALPTDDASASTRQNALQTAVQAWASNDPSAAANFLSAMPPDSANLANLAGNVASAWAKSDPQAALLWAANLTAGPEQNQAYVAALTAQASSDPQTAWANAANLTDSAARAEAQTDILAQWSDQEPADAAKMLASLPPSDALTKAINVVTDNWLREDSNAASAWVNSLPPGEARDAAALEIVNNEVGKEPATTFQWAMSIQNTATRYDAIQSTLTSWAHSDPQAAQAALQSVTGLTDDQLQNLQKAVKTIVEHPDQYNPFGNYTSGDPFAFH